MNKPKVIPSLCKLISTIMLFVLLGGATIVQAEEVTNDNTINVEDYGAKGDGITDDRIAIQNALNKGGNDYVVTVRIPAGIYNIGGTLKIKSNTILELDNDTTIVKTRLDGSMITNEKKGVKYSGSSNITIKGGTWNGNASSVNTAGFSNLFFAHAENIRIQETTVINNYGGHLIEFAGVRNGTVEGCQLYGYIGTQAKEAIQLDIVTKEGVLGLASILYDDTPCDNIKIIGNKISNFTRGVGSHLSVKGVFNTNTEISGNTFTNIKYEAINAYNYKNLNIYNNAFDDIGVAIEFKTQSTNPSKDYLQPVTPINEYNDGNYNITISNNNITNIKPPRSNNAVEETSNIDSIVTIPSGIRMLGKEGFEISNVKIIGNSIIGSPDNSIYIRNTKDSFIENNTISNSKKSGIKLVKSSNVIINSNAVKGSTEPGIYITDNSVNNTIKNNKVLDGISHGIAISNKSSDVFVENNNTINNNMRSGITVYGTSRATISENEIKDSGTNGISVTEASTVNITKNNILNSKLKEITLGSDCTSNIKSITKLIINPVTDIDTTITGQGDPGLFVETEINGSNYNANIDSSRIFTLAGIQMQEVGAKIVLSAKDIADNVIFAETVVKEGIKPVTAIIIDINNLSLNLGMQQQLQATVSPENATNKEVVWSSSDTNIITVDANGLVTAISEGQATITAMSKENANITSTCEVVVVAALTESK